MRCSNPKSDETENSRQVDSGLPASMQAMRVEASPNLRVQITTKLSKHRRLALLVPPKLCLQSMYNVFYLLRNTNEPHSQLKEKRTGRFLCTYFGCFTCRSDSGYSNRDLGGTQRIQRMCWLRPQDKHLWPCRDINHMNGLGLCLKLLTNQI